MRVYSMRNSAIRSAFVFIAMLCLVSMCQSVAQAQNTSVSDSNTSVLSTPTGRYVFGQVSNARRDQYMLDTKTGRLWNIVVDSENVEELQPVPYIQIGGGYSYVPETDEIMTAIHQILMNANLKGKDDAATIDTTQATSKNR